MNRFLAVLRFRYLRWVACAAVIPALWACNSRKLAAPDSEPSQVIKNRFQQSINRQLDLLFMIDDSSSMAPLQQKMRDRLPDFMDVLKGLPGGLPDIHVAVVSSSLGAGRFAVNGCTAGAGDRGGLFQHATACTALAPTERFLTSTPGPNGTRIENFTGGDITPVFSCIAQLGQMGCGFESQFAATEVALQKALSNDADNGGFLRDEAYLAIVMLTNEDDCSVNGDSFLFDPAVQKIRDISQFPNSPFMGMELGGLQSYRCNEFGHLCDDPMRPGMKTRPPHDPPASPVTLNGCTSAEDGTLIKVADFVSFIKSLKPAPEQQILVAAIQGPTMPYQVEGHSFQLNGGGNETQPWMVHSCTQAAGEYADPGIRIKEFLDAFGQNGVRESICANDFQPAMVRIAQVIGRNLGVQCVPANIAMKADGTPDCEVVNRTKTTTGANSDATVPHCVQGRPTVPCWELVANSPQCMSMANAPQLLNVCYDAMCSAMSRPTNQTDALVSCALAP